MNRHHPIRDVLARTYAWSRWERIRWCLRWLALGLALGAATTSTVAHYVP